MPDDPGGPKHPIRGAVAAVLLGPFALLSGLSAAHGIVSAFVAGWLPSNWFSLDPADWIMGGGVAGDAANYTRFFIFGVITMILLKIIEWAFRGSDAEWFEG